MSLRPLFCLSLSCHFTQVLLYIRQTTPKVPNFHFQKLEMTNDFIIVITSGDEKATERDRRIMYKAKLLTDDGITHSISSGSTDRTSHSLLPTVTVAPFLKP